MAGFLSGAAVDCGPSSVLKNVGGRLDVDRSLHQDRSVYTPNAAGQSSKQAFQPSRTAPVQPSHYRAAPNQSPFDLAALRQHLSPPAPSSSLAQPTAQAPRNQNWASSFDYPQTSAASLTPRHVDAAWASQFDQVAAAGPSRLRHASQAAPQLAPWQRPAYTASPPMFTPAPYATALQHRPSTQIYAPFPQEARYHEQPAMDEVRMTQEGKTAEANAAQENLQERAGNDVLEEEPVPEVDWTEDAPDDLAATLAVQPTVPEVFPLRPGATQATIPRQGIRNLPDQSNITMSDVVPNDPKVVRFDAIPSAQKSYSGVPSSLEEALAHSTSIPGVTASWEDPLVTDLSDFDEDAFMAFNGGGTVARESRLGVGDMEGWGELQKDWEEFQRGLPASSSLAGSQRGANGMYLFQSKNPYTEIMAERTAEDKQQAGRESPTLKGVLELEAAVQADPTDHHAWYALGLKQQENERESAAILALAKVVQLDPDFRPTYLALAVSYTNEGEFASANAMINKWIDMAPHPPPTVTQAGEETRLSAVERLIELARMNPEQLDPEVQIALGVLFNVSEEYAKAEDCFHAALSVRPDDWLLYNRLGATLANSGRSSEAIEYYHKALSLHPNFIRALFNLGISYINLAQYPLAAQRIVDALRLQQADATEGYATGTKGKVAKGVTSETLWHTLRSACLYMGRNDLVALTTNKDLSGFPASLIQE